MMHQTPLPRPQTPRDGVALVTGASSGIGEVLALRLASLGWTVLALARRKAALESIAEKATGAGKIIPIEADITNGEQLAQAIAAARAEHGFIALAILNAGTHIPVQADPFILADYLKTFDINVNGTLHTLAAVLPEMTERKQGQIAIVSSVAGYGPLPTAAAYGASKAALINLTAALKMDCDKLGVLVQVINPGFVETPLTARNSFEMPFLMKSDAAVERIVSGLARGAFEITFPRRFAYLLKALNLLPWSLYFKLVTKGTAGKNKS